MMAPAAVRPQGKYSSAGLKKLTKSEVKEAAGARPEAGM
jgi:hypothetical protein